MSEIGQQRPARRRQVRFLDSPSQADADPPERSEQEADSDRPRSEQLGNNQRNIVEPVALDPVIGQGAPNLNLMGRRRNRSASDGVNINKKFIIQISLMISLVHLIMISAMAYAYLQNWIELDMSQKATKTIMSEVDQTGLDIAENKLAEIYQEHNDTNYAIGICVRILMLIHLMDFMMYLSLAVIAYKDPRQIYVIYKCQFLQNCIILLICCILSLVIAANFGSTIKKIQNDTNYQQLYNWQEIKEPFVQTIALILVAEFLHVIVCIGHIRGYFVRHRHQLFGRRLRRRNRLDGEIYDYDPDYDMERYQHYLASHPPALRLTQNDHFFIEDKVLRCMNALPQFKLTVSILLSNLRLRTAEQPAIHEQVIMERVAARPKLTINTDSKNAMLGDQDSESETPDAEHVLGYDTNSALKAFGANDDDKMNRTLGRVRISRVVPAHHISHTFDLSPQDKRAFFPSMLIHSPLAQKEVELSSQRFSVSRFSTPTKTENGRQSRIASPHPRGTTSSPSDLVMATERESAEKRLPNERPVPVLIMQEYLDSSEWEGSASGHADTKEQQEQKIVQMNHLGLNQKIIPPASNCISEDEAKLSNHNQDGIEMTQEDYEQLLEKYEEVEDLTCAICIDRMRLGQSVIKTLCSGSNEVKHKHDVSHYFKDKQDLLSDNKDDDVVLQSGVLRGHKFHKGCFQKWLNMERERLQNVDEIFHRCPICRQDVMTSYQIPAGSLMHSTVVGSNVLLSSIRPFGSQRIPASSNTHNGTREECGSQNVTQLNNRPTPDISPRINNNQNNQMQMILEDLQKIQKAKLQLDQVQIEDILSSHPSQNVICLQQIQEDPNQEQVEGDKIEDKTQELE